MRTIVLFAVCSLLCAGAFAQAQRTFVASTGSDANPCSRTAPCRNFAAAVAAVAAGGEVVVLDSAGYGPVTVTKSCSIVAPAGVYAGISAFTGEAITVNAPGDRVMLRGLTLTGLGADNGLDVAAAAIVHVDGCSAAGFTGSGFVTTSAGDFYVDDSVARENAYGVAIVPSSGTVTSSVDHCRFESNSADGIDADGTSGSVTVSVHDSTVARSSNGVYATSTAAVTLKSCFITEASTCVAATTNATVSVSSTMMTDSGSGFFTGTGSSTVSFGDNEITRVTFPTIGTVTTASRQ